MNTIPDHTFDFSDHTDTELTKEWNRLDGVKASRYVEMKADAIEKECEARGIIAWDKDGEITQREERAQ